MDNFFLLKIWASLWLTLTCWPCSAPAQIIDPSTVQGTDFDSPIARQIIRLSKSAEIRNFMKPQVNACDDFYTYACGNWGQINPTTGKRPRNFKNTIQETYDRRITKFLNDDTKSSDTELIRKVKYFYESCLQRDDIKNKKLGHLLSVMEEFGGMPALKGGGWREEAFDWLQVVAEILRKYGHAIIIGVQVDTDYNNTARNRMYIGEIEEMTPARITKYFEFLAIFWETQLKAVLGLPPAKALITAREMAAFVRKLSVGVSDPLKGVGLQDKTKLTTIRAMTDKYGPTLNFTSFVQTWLGYDYTEPVYEYVESYIRNLKTVIEDTPATTVANYIMWMLAHDFQFDVEDEEKEHIYNCVKETQYQFHRYLDHLMYKDLTKFYPKIMDDAEVMFQHLKSTFENVLKSPSMSWMTEATKAKALEKLSAMNFEVHGYADVNFTQELGALTIDSGDFYGNVMSLLEHRGDRLREKLTKPASLEDYDEVVFSPMYHSDYNRITMPVFFLQPMHLWEDAYPKALHYGTMGYIIAHEMMHGFDDAARKHDAQGNINNWWDSNSSATFENRKECLRRQYGSLKYGGHMLIKNHDQGENIADVSGLRVAYEAYNDWLEHHHQTPEHLPHMDTTTARQLFFIAAAQVWCTAIERDWDEMDTHSPEAVRVQGMMSNSIAFAEAYECELGTSMNPRRKCGIY